MRTCLRGSQLSILVPRNPALSTFKATPSGSRWALPVHGHGSQNMTDVPVLLSCEQCKKRKTKCDKTFPQCSACRVANITCHPVQRTRLPRGRTGIIKQKNNALAEKVARLENLVSRLEAQVQDAEDGSASSGSARAVADKNTVWAPNRVEDLVARDFWTALSKEVTGLRQVLESTVGEDASVETSYQQRRPETHSAPNVLLFNRPSEATHSDLSTVPRPARAKLVEIYRDRVDPLFKITHWPTVLSTICHGSQDDVSPSSPIAAALEWSVCFMAACALSDKDCEDLQCESKGALIEQCRRAAEMSLSQANFLVEPTFSSLQAFTMYLMGLRCCGDGAMVWSLLALTVRLANALDLDSENNNTLSAIDLEQRRRLWFGIGLLDSQAAFGRGSTPLLSYQVLKHPPLNINDSEVGILTVSNQPSTEMSFSYLSHQAMLCQRRLCDVSSDMTWYSKAESVANFQLFATNAYSHFEFSNDPLERYTALAAKDMTMNLQLILRRPLYRSPSSGLPTSPPIDDDFDILTAALSILERGLTKQYSPEFAKWSWFLWPRWYALVIVLVELCLPPTNNRPYTSSTDRDTAYKVAQQSFANYAQSAADASSGLLWQPIVKLMRRVQQLHGDLPTARDRDHSNTFMDSAPPTSTHPNKSTILSRYHSAISFVSSCPNPGILGTSDNANDFKWDSFLDDLNQVSNSMAGSSPTTTWGLMPYPSFMFSNLNAQDRVLF